MDSLPVTIDVNEFALNTLHITFVLLWTVRFLGIRMRNLCRQQQAFAVLLLAVVGVEPQAPGGWARLESKWRKEIRDKKNPVSFDVSFKTNGVDESFRVFEGRHASAHVCIASLPSRCLLFPHRCLFLFLSLPSLSLFWS